MSAQIAAYGRLGRDPKEINTKTGKVMASCSVAVDASSGEQQETLWLDILAFERLAQSLLRHSKGDMVSVSGRLQVNHWTDKNMNDRTQQQVIADSLVSSRSVRPGGRKKQQDSQHRQQATQQFYDDELPAF